MDRPTNRDYFGHGCQPIIGISRILTVLLFVLLAYSERWVRSLGICLVYLDASDIDHRSSDSDRPLAIMLLNE